MGVSSFYGLQTSLRGLIAQQMALDTGNPLASGPMAGQMQDALTGALMSAGGLGLAAQIYKGMQSS